MPLYEYRCTYCGERFEKLMPMSASSAMVNCPVCERQRAERIMSQVATVGAACDTGIAGGGGG
ncbi:MAG TPA: zinc ribbon domain-containing protein [Chloroflexota bacterium]|nr:zinc ribbon domain-containing protein [Chloroflexota bacterium]